MTPLPFLVTRWSGELARERPGPSLPPSSIRMICRWTRCPAITCCAHPFGSDPESSGLEHAHDDSGIRVMLVVFLRILQRQR
jgi:hypothetical protein